MVKRLRSADYPKLVFVRETFVFCEIAYVRRKPRIECKYHHVDGIGDFLLHRFTRAIPSRPKSALPGGMKIALLLTALLFATTYR